MKFKYCLHSYFPNKRTVVKCHAHELFLSNMTLQQSMKVKLKSTSFRMENCWYWNGKKDLYCTYFFSFSGQIVFKMKLFWKILKTIFNISKLWPFIWTPFTHLCFVPSYIEIGLVVLEKKWNMKSLQQRQTTDIFLSVKLTSALGSGEL